MQFDGKSIDSLYNPERVNGFEPGVLICFNFALYGSLCDKCKYRDRCERIKYDNTISQNT